MSVFGNDALKKLPFVERIKLRLGELSLSVAMKLLPRLYWEEFAIQIHGELKGGSAKDDAEQRHQELQRCLADYLAGRGSGEWPPKSDGA